MGVLKGKVAIITGAGQGIGKAIALRFAREGADIVICDIATEKMKVVFLLQIYALGKFSKLLQHGCVISILFRTVTTEQEGIKVIFSWMSI